MPVRPGRRDWVQPALRKRMTAEDAPRGEQPAMQEPEALDGFLSVVRAARYEPATRAQQRRQRHPVATDEDEREPPEREDRPAHRRASFLKSPASSSFVLS